MTYRYVALGDSQSEGLGDTPHTNGTERGWTDRLATLLAQQHPDLMYANLAVRGLRSHQVLQTQVAPAREMRPDLVTVSAGVNDLLRPDFSRDRLAENLAGIADPLVSDGVVVVMVPAPPIARLMPFGRWAPAMDRRISLMNEVLAELSRDHGVLVPDDFPEEVFVDSRAWAPDRLHLNDVGHDRLARGVAAALAVGTPDEAWRAPLTGSPAPRTVLTEGRWWVSFVGPWVGRRLRGKSSADGRVAKRPRLEPWVTS